MILTEAKSSEVADHIRQAVERALSAQNLSARRASIDVVGHDGLIRDIRAGRIPSADRIAALFEYLGLEVYFGPKRSPVVPVELQVIRNLDPNQDAPTGYLTIPWHGATVGSGSAPVAFSRAWLDSHQLIPDFLQAVVPDRVDVPQLPGAETVALLDTRLSNREGVGLWCLRDGGKIAVARMTFRGDQAVLHPAKPDGEARIVNATSALAVGLLGKVVWLGESIPFMGHVS